MGQLDKIEDHPEREVVKFPHKAGRAASPSDPGGVVFKPGDLAMVERADGKGLYMVMLVEGAGGSSKYGPYVWRVVSFPGGDREYKIGRQRLWRFPVERLDDRSFARLTALRFKCGIWDG